MCTGDTRRPLRRDSTNLQAGTMATDTGLLHFACAADRGNIKLRKTGEIAAGRADYSFKQPGIARFAKALFLVNLLGLANRASTLMTGACKA